jgi:hypothetical protein
MTKKLSLLFGLLFIAGCREDRPPAPTAEESDQLNAAENMLNAEAANEKGPEDRSPGPSQ